MKRFATASVLSCSLLIGSLPAAAAPKPGNDFGAETIEIERPKASAAADALRNSSQALPPELVEEQDGPSDAGASSATSESNGETTGNGSAAGAPPSASEFTSQLNGKKIEISALIELFSKYTGRNYILDSTVKGDITILQPTPVSPEEALRLLDSILLLKGLTMVPVSDNVWKVIPAKDARQTTIPLVTDKKNPATDALVTQLIRLKHVQSEMMQQTLGQFVSKDGMITAFPSTNALILIDSSSNINRLQKLIKQLDVPAVDQDITIIPISHAEAKDIAEKLEDILGEKEGGAGGGRAPRVPRTSAVNAVAGQPPTQTFVPPGGDGAKQALPLKLIPDERTNSLIVVADAELTTKVKALVQQLDSAVDLSGGKFYVYRLKHADAEELAGILNDLVSGGGSGSSGSDSKSKTTGSSISRSNRDSGSQDRTSSGSSFGSRNTNSQFRGALSTTAGQSGSSGTGGKVAFEGDVSITADPATNSLVINAGRGDYLRLKEVIDQLDVKRPQVLVEATILEVSLTKLEGMGVEFHGTAANDNGGIIGQTNFGGLTNLLTNPTALSDLTVAAASTGTLTLPGNVVIPSQAVLITAVSRNSNVNVLSSPTVLTTDNQEAEIIVGQNVPFVTSTSTDPTNLNNTFNQVERQDVGITLRITPQISIGDFVTLKIFVEISNVLPDTANGPNGPTTTIRTTETNVEVKSGQMIVTGGLISDNVQERTRGVPVLQDIPVLGNLFKRQEQNQERTNLLVFITPRIIQNQFDARESTVDKRDDLTSVIRQQGADPSRSEILQNRSIDKVVESIDANDVKPTTITPPKSSSSDLAVTSEMTHQEQDAVSRTKQRLEALTGGLSRKSGSQASAQTPSTESDVISVKVKPKLPDAGKSAARQSIKTATTETPTATPPIAAKAPLINGVETKPSARTYVILRQLTPTDISERAGATFAYADDKGTVGILLGTDGGSPAGKFFQIGGRYQYKLQNVTLDFVCLGKYGTVEEAQDAHPQLGREKTWQTLAVAEVAALGSQSGPWAKQ